MGSTVKDPQTYHRCRERVCCAYPFYSINSMPSLNSSYEKLGGGCELALMCDIILASPTAKFGQPEINLGVIPGGGGSQRLAKTLGKSRTMELTLTGRTFSAQEAEKWGMVSRVVSEGEGEVVKEAVEMAKLISSRGKLAVQAAKEVVNAGMCFGI